MSLAVVTGAARGIGREIALALAQEDHLVLAVDRDPSPDALGVIGLQADLVTPEGRAAVERRVAETGEQLAVLVNNAGITRDALLSKLDEQAFRAVLAVNLGAPLQLLEALAPRFAEGGAVVNVSSRSYLGNVGQFNYAVSKGGVVGLTRAAALRHAPRLRINAVAPGFVATEMTDAVPAHVRERIVQRIPLGRPGSPADVAETVRWLASPASAYVTGQVLFVCGGRSYG